MAETGNYPKEIKTGHLTPLQKPGKTKGPPENLRPVILLSTLRKILAICLIKRISGRLHIHIIPITQTAYTSNRSTTELVFTFKVLAEKAISSIGYETNLLMLDMSKAFDTLKRDIIIEDLRKVLNKDEIHLVALLLENVELRVKLENQLGSAFKTNIGSPQGDGASALFFIEYLAERLKNRDSKLLSALEGLLTINPKTDKEQQEIQNELQIIKINSEKQPLPHYLKDHEYSNY